MAQAQKWSERLVEEACNVLKERRLALGMTIYRVTQESGVSQQAIAAYEKHNRRPMLDCLAKVSDALGLMPSELLAIAEKRVGKSPKQRGKPDGKP